VSRQLIQSSPVSAPPEPPPFSCEVIPERDHVRIAPSGELDLATVPELRAAVEELRASGFDHLVLDLRGMSFLDSTGLRLLLELAAEARADAHRLELIPGPPQVQRLFELSGTTPLVTFRTRASGRGAR
jgi:anti-sigma B factor antagonist